VSIVDRSLVDVRKFGGLAVGGAKSEARLVLFWLDFGFRFLCRFFGSQGVVGKVRGRLRGMLAVPISVLPWT